MTTVRLRSVAKINLDLRVLERRADGYHNLRTVFQTISLADTLDIAYAPARRLTVELQSTVEITGNLIEKAAQLLAIPGRFNIRLHKRIPMGGGLGGGSSNAAAMLLAIPFLVGKQVPLRKLIDLASQLGSDVPFFLLGGTAAGLDRGTELYPLPDIPRLPAVVITPKIHVSTAEAYRAIDEHRSGAPPAPTSHEALTWMLETAPPAAWPCCNDFETVVFPQFPQLKSIQGKLQKLGAGVALMSGSGSTLFGLFANRKSRDSAVVSLRKDLGKEVIFPVSLVSRGAYRSLWRRQLRVSPDLTIWPPQSRYAQ